MEVIKYGNLGLDKEIKMFVILQLSIRNHNNSYGYENNIKEDKNQKF